MIWDIIGPPTCNPLPLLGECSNPDGDGSEICPITVLYTRHEDYALAHSLAQLFKSGAI